MSTRTDTDDPAMSPGIVVGVLAAAGVVVTLMQTMVVPIIPRLPEYLHAAPSNTAWVITATLLAGAVVTPTVGRLGDMLGKRRMLLVSIALMIVGSIVGALSSTVIPMILGRTLQGLAMGVIPLGISLMRDVLPPARLGAAIAVMSASLGVGGAFGPPVSAAIAEYLNWHMLFWVSAVLGVVSFIAVSLVVPESTTRSGGRFDVPGAVLVSVGLVAFLLAVSKGAAWGWTSTSTLVSLLTAVAALALWAVWELRVATPVIDLRVAARPQVLLTNIASVAFGFALFAVTVVIPQVVQGPTATGSGLGRSILMSGLIMIPMGVTMLAAAPLSARLMATVGSKTTLIIGALIVAVGYVVGAFALGSLWEIAVVSGVIGGGMGIAYGAIPALIMVAVPTSQTSAANSFNTLMRSLGTSFAGAVTGVIAAQMTVEFAGRDIPSSTAFRTIMLVAGAASIVAALVTLAVPARRPALVDTASPSARSTSGSN